MQFKRKKSAPLRLKNLSTPPLAVAILLQILPSLVLFPPVKFESNVFPVLKPLCLPHGKQTLWGSLLFQNVKVVWYALTKKTYIWLGCLSHFVYVRLLSLTNFRSQFFSSGEGLEWFRESIKDRCKNHLSTLLATKQMLYRLTLLISQQQK